MTPRQKAVLGAVVSLALMLAQQLEPSYTPAFVHAIVLAVMAASVLAVAFHLARTGAVISDLLTALEQSSNAAPIGDKHPAVLAAKKAVKR